MASMTSRYNLPLTRAAARLSIMNTEAETFNAVSFNSSSRIEPELIDVCAGQVPWTRQA